MTEIDAQVLVQQVAALLVVAGAAAWLTLRWIMRRRAGCGGDCGKCAARGASPCASPRVGVRPEGLRVIQGPNVSPPGAV